ncbi:dicer-like protein 2 [Lophiostoma macrostomum CBS 122681]|uniref:Dicer-like protein 2 n=1 Tax=Lophiostoma macrostomum CBS 122681 TaxID=1314788 RepID=A0A6A6TGJ1_9PLEO|nr:dicer-like protein 2 [Lophiostoma macrostomum CBS 122681]
METRTGDTDEERGVTAALQDEPFRLRSYQAEMVEESMRANIIVVMDTGSGKTHIALSRTVAALEICEPKQLVWFLAPNVALCEQQFQVFRSNIPGYRCILLTGKDAPELWTDQSTWDNVLHNVRIVLSTHQVLLDALTHAFVRMSRLALLIFDEAHHCISDHPANRIMKDFYMPLTQNPDHPPLPRVLGLSASPVMKARATRDGLQQIEQNLNATAKSPTVHHSELIRFVHKPELSHITYSAEQSAHSSSLPLLVALQMACSGYDLTTDPYVIELQDRQRREQGISRQLQKAIISQKTYCKDQLANLSRKGEAMLVELGPSVTDWYLNKCILEFKRPESSFSTQLFDMPTTEKQHLTKILSRMPLSDLESCERSLLDDLSGKVEKLIEVLLAEHSPEFTCLVFVEQRVWVAALAEVLFRDARTRDLLSIGTFVGSSVSVKRRANVGDLIEVPNQQNTLDEFRSGMKNLIIATTVLEEGIDVSSCHLVICFEPPKNLKSFVQRRGRARKQKSKYIIFTPEGCSTRDWESLEADMKEAYLDDLRKVKEAEERELEDESETLYYKVPGTGALLTSGNASQHLHHYCALLSSGQYVDTRPQFQFEERADGSIAAKVTLPISVDPSLREAQSARGWRTERMAKNDAAFQAYKALHVSGLINDNLLPSPQGDHEEALEFHTSDQAPSLVEVSSPFDPWTPVAKQQQQNSHVYYRSLVRIQAPGEPSSQMILLMPSSVPKIPDFSLYWNETKTYAVQSSWLSGTVLSEDELITIKLTTRKLLHSVFHSRMTEGRYDFLWLLVPSDSHGLAMSHEQLRDWNAQAFEDQAAMHRIQEEIHSPANLGLVHIQGDARRYMLKDIRFEKAQTEGESPQLSVVRFPKRRDFLHRIPESNHDNEAYTREVLLDAKDCILSNLPASYSIFTLFIPSIIHKYEVYMIANTLRTTILKPLRLEESHLPLLVQALTSSSTQEDANYQRLEFLGDCILKFLTSAHLMAAHPLWTENYLTGKKGRIVSNAFLSRAALAAGLDRFILTKRFTGSKWRPQYASAYLPSHLPSTPNPTQPSKLLADVLESLIGTSYTLGSLPLALTCLHTLLPTISWTSPTHAATTLHAAAPRPLSSTHSTPPVLKQLLDYPFTNPALLTEALTHISYTGPHALGARSYERLEFLGDAVLDYIVSTRLFAHRPVVSHVDMHSVRTAVVNGAFLAWCGFENKCMEKGMVRSEEEGEMEVQEERALWMFVRRGMGGEIGSGSASQDALTQHNLTRSLIHDSLSQDDRYPWHLFALTDPPKVYSDIVESVVGAVWVDSFGDVGACERVVEKLGVLGWLDRILRDRVDCLHPKERLGHLAEEKRVVYLGVGEGERDGEEGGEKVDGDGDGHGLAQRNGGGERNRRKMYKCQVMVGGKKVGGPVAGLRRLNAETIAAWRAVRIIEGVDDVGMVDWDGVGEEEEDEEEEDVWHDAEGGIPLDNTQEC